MPAHQGQRSDFDGVKFGIFTWGVIFVIMGVLLLGMFQFTLYCLYLIVFKFRGDQATVRARAIMVQ